MRFTSDFFMAIYQTASLGGVSGIYAIVHRSSGRLYVGSASCLKTRIGYHRSKLRNGKHDNKYLRNAWNIYGEHEFDFLLLESCVPSRLLELEGFWMEKTKCCDRVFGFNLDRIATRKFHSDETKAKMKAKRREQQPFSAETRLKISAAHKGRKHPPRTPDQRANHSAARIGKKHSPETLQKLRISQRARFNKGQLSLF